jgi:dephospho-CoA kinase
MGVTGENGSGKGSFSDALISLASGSSIKLTKVKFSDVLFKTLGDWNIPATRSNLQDLALIMEKQYGEGSLTRATAEFVDKIKSDVIIVEGVRWNSDVRMIRSFKANAIVYITASPKIRFERMRKRKEKVGESSLTYKQFLKEDGAKNETYIKKIGKKADFKIENDGSVKDFEKKVGEFYKKFVLPLSK